MVSGATPVQAHPAHVPSAAIMPCVQLAAVMLAMHVQPAATMPHVHVAEAMPAMHVQRAAVMPVLHVQLATTMPHAHVHSAPMSNVANAAHQANVGIDSTNTNMFNNAAAELSAALQQLIISLSAAAISRIKARNLAGNSLFTRTADLARLSAGDIERVHFKLRPDWPYISLPAEVPPAAGICPLLICACPLQLQSVIQFPVHQ